MRRDIHDRRYDRKHDISWHFPRMAAQRPNVPQHDDDPLRPIWIAGSTFVALVMALAYWIL